MTRTILFVLGCLLAAATWADDPTPQPGPPKPQTPRPSSEGEQQPAAEAPKPGDGLDKLEALKRPFPNYDVWIDPKRKQVVVEGYICLREGALEMFACPQGTKEHESVVALNCKAFHVHAALLAVGAEPIHPVKFDPEYVPARGTEVRVEVLWRDRQGNNRRAPAQKWIKDHKTGKLLEHNWIFGGSQFWKEPGTDRELYLAEDGDLICVSNFTTATLDVPIKSSAEAEHVLFVANTPEIPALKTRVRLVLTPLLKDKDKKEAGKEN
jgi:hypothetical protein